MRFKKRKKCLVFVVSLTEKANMTFFFRFIAKYS